MRRHRALALLLLLLAGAAPPGEGPRPPAVTVVPAERGVLAVRLALAQRDELAVRLARTELRAPVDAFFDKVTVNAPDAALRANRLALLSEIRAATLNVADFSKIAG